MNGWPGIGYTKIISSATCAGHEFMKGASRLMFACFGFMSIIEDIFLRTAAIAVLPLSWNIHGPITVLFGLVFGLDLMVF